MITRFKDGNQDKIPILENIVLIEAKTDEEALSKAEEIGLSGEGDHSGSYAYEGRAATWAFGGIRKIIVCGFNGKHQPENATEVTYSFLEAKSEESLRKLISGEEVEVLYCE